MDEKLLDKLEEFKIDKEEARDNIIKNRHNHITSTYYIYLNRYLREGNTSISDLGSKEFLDYVNNPMNLKILKRENFAKNIGKYKDKEGNKFKINNFENEKIITKETSIKTFEDSAYFEPNHYKNKLDIKKCAGYQLVMEKMKKMSEKRLKNLFSNISTKADKKIENPNFSLEKINYFNKNSQLSERKLFNNKKKKTSFFLEKPNFNLNNTSPNILIDRVYYYSPKSLIKTPVKLRKNLTNYSNYKINKNSSKCSLTRLLTKNNSSKNDDTER